MWALFCSGIQVSRAFPSEEEAWKEARESDLVEDGRLTDSYEIKRIARERESAA